MQQLEWRAVCKNLGTTIVRKTFEIKCSSWQEQTTAIAAWSSKSELSLDFYTLCTYFPLDPQDHPLPSTGGIVIAIIVCVVIDYKINHIFPSLVLLSLSLPQHHRWCWKIAGTAGQGPVRVWRGARGNTRPPGGTGQPLPGQPVRGRWLHEHERPEVGWFPGWFLFHTWMHRGNVT